MIPSLVSYPNFETFEAALREHYNGPNGSLFPEHADAIVRSARELFDAKLPPIPNATAFALLLGVSPRLISSMALTPARYWRVFRLQKRNGSFRTITAPRVFLKTIQTFILQSILSSHEESPAAYGFSKGKSIFRNATNHVQKSYVWNTDIIDFFPSISHHQVREVFVKSGFDSNMANVLGSLCTFRGALPQGAPTSPKLSNLIFREADNEFLDLAMRERMTYSRYADDLTFSSAEPPSDAFIAECDDILARWRFRRNYQKTRLHGPHQARYVTGLVVNEKVHPDRKTRRTMRSVFHSLQTGGVINEKELPQLRGWASYVHAYDRDLGKKYLRSILECRVEDGAPFRLPKNRRPAGSAPTQPLAGL